MCMIDRSIIEQVTVHPWQRFFARSIDGALITYLLIFAFEIIFPAWDTTSIKPATAILLFLGFILIWGCLSMLSNAILMNFTGTTFGKWLFGIIVRDKNNNRLSFNALLKREYLVYKEGLGFGLPLIKFFTLLHSRSRLKRLGYTNWDLQLDTQVLCRNKGLLHNLLIIFGVALFLLMDFFIGLLIV